MISKKKASCLWGEKDDLGVQGDSDKNKNKCKLKEREAGQ